MKASVLACHTMADEVQKVIPAGMDLEILPYALHRTPQKLKQELQQRVDADAGHDTILLAYGLCSCGVVNLHSGRHTLVIPRIHDCISLLMGAREIYDQEFARFPATYYLSKGWIDQGAEPYAEFLRYREEYGEEAARWIIETEYSHYQRVVFIHTGLGETERYTTYARRVAEFIHVAYEERQGSLRLLEKLFRGEWDAEFVVTPPGRMVMQRSFL